MKKIFFLISIVLCTIFIPLSFSVAQQPSDSASEGAGGVVESEPTKATLHLFYSVTCPHCREEKAFLASIEDKYPNLTIQQYDVSDSSHYELWRELARIHGTEDRLGAVPATFIGEYHFIGFDTDETTGRDIELAIQATLGESEEVVNTGSADRQYVNVPFLGRIYSDEFSLPILAIVLGFLDGFNVCSLGALVLIIGLTLKLQRRKAILLLGGTFIATTAIIYGGLIVAWASIFELFSAHIDAVKIIVALLAFTAGLYFFKEYFRMRKQGPTCEFQESKIIQRLMERTGRAFEDNTRLLGLLGSVFLFAAVVAVVEFPCSAATPLVFAGMLSSAGIVGVGKIAYIALFVLFYMLDEIIIFGIAAYRLKIWMTSGTFTKYAVLAEACVLLCIGLLYLVPAVKGVV